MCVLVRCRWLGALAADWSVRREVSARYDFQSRPTTAYSEDSVAAPQGGMTALAHNKVRAYMHHTRAAPLASPRWHAQERRATHTSQATSVSKPPARKRNLANLILNAKATQDGAAPLASPGGGRKRKGAATLFHLAHAWGRLGAPGGSWELLGAFKS